jgi:uncharacterized protein
MTELVQVTDRLAGVPGDWDGLVGDDGFYLCRDWLRFVESEPGTRARYLFSAESGALRGALPLYRGEDAPNVRYQPAHFHEFLGVDGTFLLAGSSRGYRSTLLLPPTDRVGALSRSGVLGELLAAAAAIAKEDGYAGVILPFLPTRALLEVARTVPVRAAYDVAEAELSGVGGGIDTYLQNADGKIRTKVRGDRARFAAAGWHIRTCTLDECWRDAAGLLANLEHKHGHTSRDLGMLEQSVARQARVLGPRSVVFICEDEAGIAGISWGYRWRSTLFTRAAGFDYSRLRDGREYFNVGIYAPIEYSQQAGIERLHLGIGSWEAKAYRGAAMAPLWSAVILSGAEPRLELVGSKRARQALADFRGSGVAVDAAQWAEVEEFATTVD